MKLDPETLARRCSARLAFQDRTFFERTDRSSLFGCWEWTGGRLAKGYGVLHRNKRLVLAHRRAYTLAVGPIPAGKMILHSCDNPPCVNPAHLRPGTVRDNARDAVERGRLTPPTSVGSANAAAKLTEVQVRNIRRLYSKGAGGRLADQFGVSRSTVCRIAKGKAWVSVR